MSAGNISFGFRICSTHNIIFCVLILLFVSLLRLVDESLHGRFNLRSYYSKPRPHFTVQKYWSANYPKYLVCRIHNACFRRDGAVLVHHDAEKYLEGCSTGKRGIFSSKEEYRMYGKTVHGHLLRRVPARQHIPHFLSDILPVIMSSELIWPSKAYTSRRATCNSPVDNSSACGRTVWHFKRPQSRMRYGAGVLLAFKDEMHVNISDWIARLTSMLPGRPKLRSRDALFSKSKERSVCFSSIILHPPIYLESKSKEWFSGSNRLYSDNGLTRSPRKRSDIVKRVVSNGSHTKICYVQAVIVNRKSTSKRHIVNVLDVQSVLKNLRSTKLGLNVSVKVSVVYFENKTIKEQINPMQKADIIVGAHGAGLSNIIFARMRTRLVEIFPQFYYMSDFYKLSEILDLRYSSVVAEPDDASFTECLAYFFEKRRVNNSFLLNAKNIWNERIKIISANRSERPALPVWPMPGGYYLRQCVRNQQLMVNITEIKEYVSNAIEEVCQRKDEN